MTPAPSDNCSLKNWCAVAWWRDTDTALSAPVRGALQLNVRLMWSAAFRLHTARTSSQNLRRPSAPGHTLMPNVRLPCRTCSLQAILSAQTVGERYS